MRTHIGYGSPNKQDSFEAHGSPLGADEVRLTKENLGWPVEPPFLVPDAALAHFREALARGARDEAAWNARLQAYAQAFPDLAAELQRRLRGELPAGWDAGIPVFPADAKGMATRVASGKVMNAIAPRLPALDRRFGRPGPVDQDRAQGPGRLQSAGARRAPTRRARTAAAGATPGATCTSACASTRWAPS